MRLAPISALLLLGCSDPAVPITVGVIDAGGAQLEITDAPSLTLSRGGTVLLRFDAAGFPLGVVGAVSDEHNYDPYLLEVPNALYDAPPDLLFVIPESAVFVASEEGTLALELRYPEGIIARLDAAVHGESRFALHLTPTGDRAAFLRLAAHGNAGEGFYGLGEYFDDVNHRGQVRAMQIEPDGTIESGYNEAHVPVPVVTGTTGWGLFVESPYPGSFAMGVASADQVQATFGTGVASNEGLPFYLYAAEHPLDLTRHYYAITGFPRLPARWALGPIVWRDENDDQVQVESDLDIIRDLDLATSGYWIDRPYATAVNTFDFLPTQFPDPPAMVEKMHALGFRTALWHTPYLDEKHEAAAQLKEHAQSEGYYPPQNDIFLNGWGRPLDLTNPAAQSWWREQLGAYLDLGVEGFKLDYGEDVLNGLFLKRSPWLFADGRDERTMHSQYTRAYHDTYASLLEDGGFLLCRAGTYGDQVNGPIIWPGDLDANFAEHREPIEVDGKTILAVGGLPASIIAGLSLGPSGFPFYGADTGGYRHSPVDKEVFMRWFEQTALSTVMQIGTSANDVAWELGGENGFDQQSLDSYRVYTRLHLRLWPYLWSYAVRLRDDGRPIQRALGLAHPEIGLHPNDIYLLGDALLVAPVVEGGATTKTVIFPAGRWIHWFTGEVFEGPGEFVVDAPLGRLPLFLHESGVVPLLRPTIDTLAPTTDPARVDSYATDPGLLWARLVARGGGSFSLFDGGAIAQESAADTSELSCTAGSELSSGCLLELLDADGPQNVSSPEAADLAALEAAPGGWLHDAAARTLWIKLAPNASATVTW
jgi:alpha-D-xyloside xylohydrolase